MIGLNNFRVGTRLIVGFSLLMAFTIIMTMIGYRGMNTIHSSLYEVTHNEIPKIALVNAMRDAVRFQSIALRDIVLQEDLAFKKTELKRMRGAREEYQLAADKLIAREPRMQSLLQGIQVLEEKVKDEMMATIDLSLDDFHQEAGDKVRGPVRSLQLELITELETLLARYENDAKLATDRAERTYTVAWQALIAMGIIAGALGIGIALLTTSSIVKPLRRAVAFANRIAQGDLRDNIAVTGRDETAKLLHALNEMNTNLSGIISGTQSTADNVATLSHDLMRNTHEVARRAHEQSDRVATVSATVEEISASIEEIARGAGGVFEASSHTDEIVRDNHKLVDTNAEGSEKIVSTVESAVKAIHELSDEIKKITDVTDVIDTIADQTNLLALNATIEAARAGDHGRGFALVADEVRVLSKRTAASTADIATMVNTIKLRSTDAVDRIVSLKTVVNESAQFSELIRESLDKVVESAGNAMTLSRQISESTHEQTKATNETATNMHAIHKLTQDNTDTIQSCSATASQLNEAAASLSRLVSQFQLSHSDADRGESNSR